MNEVSIEFASKLWLVRWLVSEGGLTLKRLHSSCVGAHEVTSRVTLDTGSCAGGPLAEALRALAAAAAAAAASGSW